MVLPGTEVSLIKTNVSSSSPQKEEETPPKGENLFPMKDPIKDYTQIQGTKYSSFDCDDLDDYDDLLDVEEGREERQEGEPLGTSLQREEELAEDEDRIYA